MATKLASRVKYREAEGERPRGQVDVRSGHPGGCWSAVDTASTTDQPTRNGNHHNATS